MFEFLNCCSYGAKVSEPKAQIVCINNIHTEANERLLHNSFADLKKFNPAGFVLEWMPESIKNIKEEIKNLEKLQAKKGIASGRENFYSWGI